MADNKSSERREETVIATKKNATSVLALARDYGANPIPPTALAALITAQALRPPSFLPLLFPPVLLFSTYLNISDYKTEGAGLSAAWSSLYLLLARRRKQTISSRFSTRGIIRGTTSGLCLANLLSGGLVYLTGKGYVGEDGEPSS